MIYNPRDILLCRAWPWDECDKGRILARGRFGRLVPMVRQGQVPFGLSVGKMTRTIVAVVRKATITAKAPAEPWFSCETIGTIKSNSHGTGVTVRIGGTHAP